jgi:ABC-2 type transport system ATP-binding protein
MNVIEVRDLHVSYGETVAVDGISFSVEQGEVLAIVGPNGAGKTSTVETMLGLRRADGGSVSVLGLDPQRDREAVVARVGAQLQQAAVPDRLRVHEALDLYASFYERQADWNALLEQWGLSEKRNAPFASLSGGQKQRLFIAMALVNDPEIVFLDEITTGLDPKARRSTLDLVRDVKSQGKTVVLVSHYLDEVEALADRVAIIDHGHLVAIGTPRELCRTHGGSTEVRFTASPTFDADVLRTVPGVAAVRRSAGQIVANGTGAILAHIAAALVGAGDAPEDLTVKRPNLEEVYFALTGEQSIEGVRA